jgi:hypothetical protein
MKKIIIIVISIVVVILVALGIFLIVKQNGSNGTGDITTGTLPPNSTSTPQPPIAAPTSTMIVIGTNQGTVSVSNFYKSAAYITQDKQTVVLQQDSRYDIEYNVGDSSFGIAILSEPLEAVREAAEAALLSKLGISKQDACKLTVYEGVPASVSDKYVGQSFSLSFCGAPSTL